MSDFFPNEEDFNKFAEQEFPGKITKYQNGQQDKYCFIQAGSNWGDLLHYELYEGKMQFHIEGSCNNWQKIRQCLENDKTKYGLTSEQWGIRKPGRWILNDEIDNKENLFASFIKIRNMIEPTLIDIDSNNDLLKDLTYKKAVEYLNKNNEIIRVPTYQRGRVWRPSQVELLWDSILRGFPIGSFILSKSHINGKQDEKVYYDLMDGQQRINALKLGFEHDKKDNAMLWIDLKPEIENYDKNSTRKFWVKVTTKAHPWGFENNDICSTLNAPTRKDAKTKFTIDQNEYNTDKFDLDRAFPFRSTCPVPMYIIMKSGAAKNPQEEFQKLLNQEKENNKPWALDNNLQKFNPNNYFYKILYYANLSSYSNLSVNLLTDITVLNENEEIILKTSDDSGNAVNEKLTSLEILFRRINTGGTRISQAELNYSSIKAFWGDSVRASCDDIAKKCMPPQNLALLVFRLADMLEHDKWVNDISIAKIRSISFNEGSKSNITDLFKSRLDGIVTKVNQWLLDNDKWGMPTVIRTDLARNYSDIYLLLMWFANRAITKKDNANSVLNTESEVYSDNKFIIALSLYLKWFANDVRSCCSTIFKYCSKDLSKNAIIISLLECYRLGYVKNIFNTKLPDSIEDEKINEDWNISKNANWFPLWENVKSNIDLLLYAERIFIKNTFSTYDPADIEMWEEYNRPWDFDHIIPTSWVYNKKSGDYRNVVNNFIYVIGNQAAIPFEENRGKNNKPDWSYYNNLDGQLKDLAIEKAVIANYIKTYSQIDTKDPSSQLRSNTNDAAIYFVKKTYERTVNIFNNDCLSLLRAIKLDPNDSSFSGSQNKYPIIERKNIFEKISKNLLEDKTIEGKYYIISNDNTEREIKGNPTECEWANPWISYEIETKDKHYMISITSHGRDEQDKLSFEFGLRKNPESIEVDYKFAKDNEAKFKLRSEKIQDMNIYTNNVWWYMCKEYSVEGNKELSDNYIDEIINNVSTLLCRNDEPILKVN